MVAYIDKHLTKQELKEIVQAIVAAEKMTSGEIRVHLRRKCGPEVMREAKKTFYRLRMQKTKLRNGVLIFVALKSRRFAILGDSGIHAHVGDSFWDDTRDKIGSYFSKDRIKDGIVKGVLTVGEKLMTYFPVEKNDKNELSNKVTGR